METRDSDLQSANARLHALQEQARRDRASLNNVYPRREITTPGIPTTAVVDCPANNRTPSPLGTAVVGGLHTPTPALTAVPSSSSSSSPYQPAIEQSMIRPAAQGTAVSWNMRNTMQQLQARRGVVVSPTPLRCDVEIEPVETHPPTPTEQLQDDWVIPASFDAYGRILERFKATGVILLWWLVMWAVGKANGRNYVPVDILERHFTGAGKFRLCQRNHFRYKVLKDGAHLGLWDYDRKHSRVYFASRAKVAIILGLGAVGGTAVTVNMGDLCAGLVSFRAHCHATGLGSKGDGFSYPISRQNIKTDTGLDKRTQRKYEGMAHVVVRHNYEFVGDFTHSKYERIRETERLQYQLTGECVKPAVVVSCENKNTKRRPTRYIARQMPNSFNAKTNTVAHSRRRLNKRIENLRNKLPGNGPTAVPRASAFGTVVQPTRYYDGHRQANPNAVGRLHLSGRDVVMKNGKAAAFWKVLDT